MQHRSLYQTIQIVSPTNQNPRALSNSPRITSSTDSDNSPSKEVITVNYLNESSNIQIKLDPSKEQFYLDLRGMRPVDKDSIVVIDSSLVQNRAKRYTVSTY